MSPKVTKANWVTVTYVSINVTKMYDINANINFQIYNLVKTSHIFQYSVYLWPKDLTILFWSKQLIV